MRRKVILFLARFVLNTPNAIKELVSIKILKLHRKIDVIQTAIVKRNIVILAIFPGNTSLNSLKRTLDGIDKANYSILAVINKNYRIKEILSLLKSFDCNVIVRPNIGRDIGAYQSGLNYLGLNKLSTDFDNVALINDSLYLTEKNKNFYSNFLAPSQWNCIYLNKQGIHHASSHSLIFNEKAISSKEFLDFWRTYYPSSNREHSIFKGEFGITECVGEDYFKPLVSPELINDAKFSLKLTPIEASQIRVWSRKSGYQGYELLVDYMQTNQYVECMYYCLENFQVSNSLGTVLYRKFGLPIKLDLPSSGLVSIESFVNLISDAISLEEESFLRTRLSQPSPKFVGPYWFGLSKIVSLLKS
jgi:hypothetical protein